MSASNSNKILLIYYTVCPIQSQKGLNGNYEGNGKSAIELKREAKYCLHFGTTIHQILM